jgi:hypothetical protein
MIHTKSEFRAWAAEASWFLWNESNDGYHDYDMYVTPIGLRLTAYYKDDFLTIVQYSGGSQRFKP